MKSASQRTFRNGRTGIPPNVQAQPSEAQREAPQQVNASCTLFVTPGTDKETTDRPPGAREQQLPLPAVSITCSGHRASLPRPLHVVDHSGCGRPSLSTSGGAPRHSGRSFRPWTALTRFPCQLSAAARRSGGQVPLEAEEVQIGPRHPGRNNRKGSNCIGNCQHPRPVRTGEWRRSVRRTREGRSPLGLRCQIPVLRGGPPCSTLPVRSVLPSVVTR